MTIDEFLDIRFKRLSMPRIPGLVAALRGLAKHEAMKVSQIFMIANSRKETLSVFYGISYEEVRLLSISSGKQESFSKN